MPLYNPATAAPPVPVELEYVEFTSAVNITATTEGGADTIVTAGAVVLDGSTEILIEFGCPYCDTPGGGADRGTHILLYAAKDGGAAASLGFISSIFNSASNASRNAMYATRRYTPASGSYVYSIRGFVTAGTGHANAGAGGSGNWAPGWIRISEV